MPGSVLGIEGVEGKTNKLMISSSLHSSRVRHKIEEVNTPVLWRKLRLVGTGDGGIVLVVLACK